MVLEVFLVMVWDTEDFMISEEDMVAIHSNNITDMEVSHSIMGMGITMDTTIMDIITIMGTIITDTTMDTIMDTEVTKPNHGSVHVRSTVQRPIRN